MNNLEKKYKEIHDIIDGAEKALTALGVPYFLSVVDRDTRDPDGGKVFVSSEMKAVDMQQLFKHAFPHNRDLVMLGQWLGGEIMRRNKDAAIKFVDKKKARKTKKENGKAKD